LVRVPNLRQWQKVFFEKAEAIVGKICYVAIFDPHLTVEIPNH
jgi:hypothetical protein